MKTLISIVFVVCAALTASSSTTTATSSGDWTENSNWDNGAPGCFDTIVIPAGIQIDITSTQNLEGCSPGLDSIIILISGRLEFQNGKKLKLPCDSDVYVGNGGSVGVGSGGGSSTYIETCGNQYWNASGGDLNGPSELCDGGCNTLPIELISFTAIKNVKGRRVDLFWQTMSETDNDYFTVERSKDAMHWEDVCQTKGAGNSSTILDYYEADYSPLNGVNYYRLKQTDFNGEFAYSPVVSIVQNNTENLLVYPNPVSTNEQLVVSFPDKYNGVQQILICDLSGKSVLEIERDVTSVHQLIVTLPSDLASGAYYLFAGDEKSIIVVE